MKTVFVSHNANDKPFVRRLSEALKYHSIKCWVDESEIKYGESLIQKISDAIENIDLVLAVISKNSVFSGWVRKELEWAMTKEINNRKVVVIPILIDKIDIPFFLSDKLYADFTDKNNFFPMIKKLAVSINGRNYNLKLNIPGYGESVNLKYEPTQITFIISLSVIALSVFALLAIIIFFEDFPKDDPIYDLRRNGLIFFTLIVALQFGELIKIYMLRYLIHIDPSFAYDAGLIRITSLFFRRYRRIVKKHWSKLLIKVSVFIEILVTVGILVLMMYAYNISKFLF